MTVLFWHRAFQPVLLRCGMSRSNPITQSSALFILQADDPADHQS